MGTASHAMWSPAWSGAHEPRRSSALLSLRRRAGAPLAHTLRDGLRLAAPVAATALAVAALAAPTTSRLDDLSTWVPNAAATAPAGPGAATAGPAGDGHVTVRIDRRSPRPAAGGPLTVLSAPFSIAPAQPHAERVPRRVASKPDASRPATAAGPAAPARTAPAPAASPAPAPAASAPAPAEPAATAPASGPAKRSPSTAKAKPKAAPAAATSPTSTEQSYTASSASGSPVEDKRQTKAEKAGAKDTKRASNGR